MAPLLVLAIWLEVNHVGIRQRILDTAASEKAQNLATHIDNQIRAQIAALEVLASSPLIDDPARWSEFYTMALSFRSGFGGHVILADTSMQMLINTRSKLGSKLPKLPVPKGRAAAPIVLQTGEPTVGDSFLGPIAGEQLVAVVVPVVRGGRIRYLLLGTIETRRYQNLIENLAMPAGWLAVLRDGGGEIMAGSFSIGSPPDRSSADWGTRFIARSKVATWWVTIEIPAPLYVWPLLLEGAVLALGLVAAGIISFVGGRTFSNRLTRAVASIAVDDPCVANRWRIDEIDEVHDRLFGAFTARDLSEIAYKERNQLNKALIEHLPQSIYIKDKNAEYILCNNRYARSLGIEANEILGKTDFDYFPRSMAEALDADDRAIMAAGEIKDSEERRSFHGEERWFHTIKVPFRADDGTIIGLIGSLTDISERKAAEDRINRSLLEKENLLRELYHRTYNNMQLIQAMMILQAENHPDTPLPDFILRISHRVEIMATVHRTLFQSEDLSRIDLGSFISGVADLVKRNFDSIDGRVSFEMRLARMPVLFDVAVPLGLVVYELLTNALTHAFPDGRNGTIRVFLARDESGSIRLDLADDGIGCTRDWDDPDNARLGLQLVDTIIRNQLLGEIRLDEAPGTTWRIAFFDTHYKERV